MIVSKRIKVPRGNVPGDRLLEYMHEYLRNRAGGKVLRYAIVDASGKDFIVDLSVREDATVASAGSTANQPASGRAKGKNAGASYGVKKGAVRPGAHKKRKVRRR